MEAVASALTAMFVRRFVGSCKGFAVYTLRGCVLPAWVAGILEVAERRLVETGIVTNPYAPPSSDEASDSSDRLAEIRAQVSRPATALVVMASVNAVFPSIAIVGYVVAAANGVARIGGVESFVLFVVQFGLFVAISIGAAKLGHLESYRFARFAAVCACIPGISPFIVLGIPFGVWALVLLADPEVRAAFPDGAR